MRIQRFDEFIGPLNEDSEYGDYYHWEPEGKNPFSKWLRGIDRRAKHEIRDIMGWQTPTGSSTLGKNDPYKKSKEAATILPGAVRLIAGAGALISDFFTPKRAKKKGDEDSEKDKSGKGETKKSKKKVLDDWAKAEMEGKDVTDFDAEKFYKSGVLQGKKYFGKDFDPLHPTNNNERAFADYLQSAMGRYYGRIQTSPRTR